MTNLNILETNEAHRALQDAFGRLFNSLGPIDVGRDRVLFGQDRQKLATDAMRVAKKLDIPVTEIETLVGIMRDLHRSAEHVGTRHDHLMDALIDNLEVKA